MAKIKQGTIVYASSDCREAFLEARALVDERGWSKSEVRIMRDRERDLLMVEYIG